MIDCVLSGLIAALNPLFIRLLLRRAFGYEARKTKMPTWILLAVLVAAQAGFPLCCRDNEMRRLVLEIGLMAEAVGLSYSALKAKKRGTFIWFGLMVCAIFDYIVFAVLSVVRGEGYTAELSAYVSLYAAAFVLTWLLLRTGRMQLLPDFLEQIPPFLCVVVFLAEFSAYYAAALPSELAQSGVAENALRLLSAALFLGSLVFLVVRYHTILRFSRESELRHTLEVRRYEELMAQNRDVRAFRHDFKNNLLALHTLLQSGRTEDAAEYIRSLTDTIEQTRSAYMTGNLLADAILTDKAAHAKESGISILFDGAIPNTGVNNRDLCTILSNALDNAVTGCRDCAPCAVRVFASMKPGALNLQIENPVAQKVPIRHGTVKTSKSDALNHGFGLANIRKTAQAYNGYANISCDEKRFTLEIGLILREAER